MTRDQMALIESVVETAIEAAMAPALGDIYEACKELDRAREQLVLEHQRLDFATSNAARAATRENQT